VAEAALAHAVKISRMVNNELDFFILLIPGVSRNQEGEEDPPSACGKREQQEV